MHKITTLVIVALALCVATQGHGQSAVPSWVPFGPIGFFDAHKFGDGRVAIATEGYILWSDDNGETFQPQFFPENPFFLAIEFIDDTHGYVAGSNGWIYSTTDAGRTWVKISSPTTFTIMDLTLTPTNNLFVLDYWGKVHVSSSGGETWSAIDIQDSLSAPFEWSGSKVLVTGSAGALYAIDPLTLDHQRIGTPLTNRINAFDASGDTIVACFGQLVARSLDRGKSWSTNTENFAGNVQVVNIMDDLRTMLIFVDGPYRYRSTDLGVSWTALPLHSLEEKFSYLVRRLGWVGKGGWLHFIGWLGTVYAVAPDGVEQRILHQCSPNLPFDKVFIRQVPAYPHQWRGTAEFYSSLFITSDNGWSWLVRDDPYVGRKALGVVFIDSGVGIIPSAIGKNWSPAYSTSDDGLSWNRLEGAPRDSGQYMMPIVAHDDMLELPTYVHVFRSYDGGRSWPDTLHYEDPVPKEAQFRGGIADASFFGRDTIYLRLTHSVSSGFHTHTFVRSTDAGNTWSQYLKLPVGKYTSMAFATPNNGFIAGDDGVLETKDGGLSWSHRALLEETGELRSIAFNSNGSVGVISGLNGVIYHTLDSGVTWTRDTALVGGTPGIYPFTLTQFINDSTAVIQSNAGFFRRTFDLPTTKSVVERSKFENYFYAFLYPNPVTEDRLKVYLHGLHAVSNKATLSYEIQDSWGRIVQSKNSFGARASEVALTKEIGLGDLSSGIYYLRISCTDGMRVIPFSVVK